MNKITQGWHSNAVRRDSPFFNERPSAVELLVIHNISLPKGQFTGEYVDQLFMGTIDCDAEPTFESLRGLEVSSHFFIRRDGSLIQYVSVDDRAWHAGVSSFNGRDNCNDFAVGIELEGTDEQAYTESQYRQLIELTKDLMSSYSISLENIVGHCDIAPGRKTDPGVSFDWQYYRSMLRK